MRQEALEQFWHFRLYVNTQCQSEEFLVKFWIKKKNDAEKATKIKFNYLFFLPFSTSSYLATTSTDGKHPGRTGFLCSERLNNQPYMHNTFGARWITSFYILVSWRRGNDLNDSALKRLFCCSEFNLTMDLVKCLKTFYSLSMKLKTTNDDKYTRINCGF